MGCPQSSDDVNGSFGVDVSDHVANRTFFCASILAGMLAGFDDRPGPSVLVEDRHRGVEGVFSIRFTAAHVHPEAIGHDTRNLNKCALNRIS